MLTKDDLFHCMDVVACINHDMTPREASLTYNGGVETVIISVYPHGFEEKTQSMFWAVNGYKQIAYEKFVENGENLDFEDRTTYKDLNEMLLAVKMTGKEKKRE